MKNHISKRLYSRNLTLKKKVDSGKHNPQSPIAFDKCAATSFWELLNGLKNDTNCTENIFEKLPTEGIRGNNTMDLKTTIKAPHVNEEISE